MHTSPSVLIVRLDAIGDALTLVPLIAALRARGMGVGAVLRPANAEVFSQRALDRRHIIVANLALLAAELEARHYRYALVATEKPAGYRLAAKARIAQRIGFENGWGKPLKTLWVRHLCTQTIFRTAGLDPRAPHECEVVFSLAKDLLPDLQPSRDPALLREYVLDRIPPPDTRIAFQVTAKWERLGAHFDALIDLARRVAVRHAVRWIASEQERAYAERFAQASGYAIDYFAAVPEWKEALAAARALVAPDSGAVHVAGMIGTPVVACFAAAGFTLQSARWSPWAAPHRIVKIDDVWPMTADDALGALLSGNQPPFYRG